MGLGCTRQSTVCITWREVIARLSSTAWSASRTRFAASFIHESFGPQFRCSRVFGISCEENVCEREEIISTPFFLVVERMIPSLFFSFSVFISRYFWNREKEGGGQGSVDSLGLQRNLDVWKNLSLVGFGVCSDQLSVYSRARTCKLLAGVSRGDTFYDPLV